MSYDMILELASAVSTGPEVSLSRHSLVACCDVQCRVGAMKSTRNAISLLQILNLTWGHRLGVPCSGGIVADSVYNEVCSAITL